MTFPKGFSATCLANHQGNYELGSENYEEDLWGWLSELEMVGFRRERGCATHIEFPLEATQKVQPLYEAKE
jgi:hypothetical protein